jgi:hypothetical protein
MFYNIYVRSNFSLKDVKKNNALGWYSLYNTRTSYVHCFGRGLPYSKSDRDNFGQPFVVNEPMPYSPVIVRLS